MPCIEPTPLPSHPRRGALPAALLLAAGLISGCGQLGQPGAPSPPPAPAAPAGQAARPPASATPDATARPAAPPAAAAARRPIRPTRTWAEYQQQAAERLVEANPGGTYLGEVPEPLLAIPVLEIELNADGSVRRIDVKRKPTQALDTVQLAIAAVQRAAPFAPVGHLPRPWKFTEVFLFNDDRRFKPRTLDL